MRRTSKEELRQEYNHCSSKLVDPYVDKIYKKYGPYAHETPLYEFISKIITGLVEDQELLSKIVGFPILNTFFIVVFLESLKMMKLIDYKKITIPPDPNPTYESLFGKIALMKSLFNYEKYYK